MMKTYQADMLEPFCKITVETKYQDMSVTVKNSDADVDQMTSIFQQVLAFLSFPQDMIDEAFVDNNPDKMSI
jgi:hypothetical protein